MKSSILTLILGLFLSTPVFAFRTLILEGDNRDFKCNYQNALLKTMKNNSELVTSLNNLNFSPECLNPDQKRFIEISNRTIKGFTFGMNGSLSKTIGLEGGMELVFTIYNRHTLMAGLVKYSGGGINISLPFGAGPVFGVIDGDCNSIEKYLGNFNNFSLFGFNKSIGSKNELTNPQLSKCNSSSNSEGLSMSLLGYSLTRYSKASEFILLKGQRVDEIIDFIDQYHNIED